MTRVAIYPADLGGCGHYRLIWPARALQAEGVDIDLVLPNEPVDRQLQVGWWEGENGDTEVVDAVTPDADIVVMQRPIDRHRVTTLALLQEKGVRIVVEIDDDFDNVHPQNVAWPRLQPHISAERNKDWLHIACDFADMVVVSTPRLAERYGSHGRVRVVRNRVPARYLSYVADEHDALYVGWSGSTETHPDDLQVMGAGFARALRSSNAEMAIVGTGRGVRRITGIDHDPLASGWRMIGEYPEALTQFDVGVVPLSMTPFNQAKSCLKGLEMAAVGVPFIASPTDEYRWFCAQGVGLLATKPKEWERMIKQLCASAELRAEMSGRGREVAAGHTVQGHAEEWWNAWSAALDREPVAA
jgi:glycosyltransferase involved in cell wall biosynthesis